MADPAAAIELTDQMPVPFGIEGRSGKSLPELTNADLENVAPGPAAARARATKEDHLGFVSGVDPLDLSSAGWGVVFAKGTDPKIRQALEPLLQHRKKQAGALYLDSDKVAIQPTDTATGWLDRRFGVSSSMPVQPEAGAPLYLLLIGSPEEIPFEFQYGLDNMWNVGRLHFDTAEEYAIYAENVVAYETAATVRQAKRAAFWSTKNPGDTATGLLFNQVMTPLLKGQETPTVPIKAVGDKAGFQRQEFVGKDATKAALLDLLRGKKDPPALLFTGSHGLSFPLDDPMQREFQGALLCQEWSKGENPDPSQYVTGAEVLKEADATGMIHFLFACYGGGCPSIDNFRREKTKIMEKPVISRIPQALLKKGALAVFAHVDRAWAASFQASLSKRGQAQGFRDVMNAILAGTPVGQATDNLNHRWSILETELQSMINKRDAGAPITDQALADMWTARDDARNYIVLGDPAVRLRVDKMQA